MQYLRTIELSLNTLDDLFQQPELSPFSPTYAPHHFTSGIEYVVNELAANTSCSELRLVLSLPADQITAGTDEHIQTAIFRYSQAKLLENDQKSRKTYWRGTRALIISIVALVLCISASEFVLSISDSLLATIISRGFSIAGWVAIWFPLDTLVFATWQHRLDAKIYRMLRDSELVVQLDFESEFDFETPQEKLS